MSKTFLGESRRCHSPAPVLGGGLTLRFRRYPANVRPGVLKPEPLACITAGRLTDYGILQRARALFLQNELFNHVFQLFKFSYFSVMLNFWDWRVVLLLELINMLMYCEPKHLKMFQ